MRPGLGCTRTDEGTEGGSLSTREAVGVAAAGKDDVLLVGSGELLACSGECRSGSMTGSGGIEVGSSPGRREPVAIAGSEEGSEAVIGVGREVGSEERERAQHLMHNDRSSPLLGGGTTSFMQQQ